MTVPVFKQHPFSCKYGHEWIGHLPYQVEVSLWSAHVKALRCPNCGKGAKFISMGHKPKETPVDTSQSIAVRYQAWESGFDTGLSSECLGRRMCEQPNTGQGNSYPYDAHDLSRCLRLLRIIPEWRPRIGEMAACGPVWAAMAARWDELEKSLEDEVGVFWEKGKHAPKTYALLQQIREEK